MPNFFFLREQSNYQRQNSCKRCSQFAGMAEQWAAWFWVVGIYLSSACTLHYIAAVQWHNKIREQNKKEGQYMNVGKMKNRDTTVFEQSYQKVSWASQDFQPIHQRPWVEESKLRASKWTNAATRAYRASTSSFWFIYCYFGG